MIQCFHKMREKKEEIILKKLIKIRKLNKFSQIDLAKKLGVKSNTISQWESGKRRPDIEKLKKLAEIFNCKVDDLLQLKKISN